MRVLALFFGLSLAAAVASADDACRQAACETECGPAGCERYQTSCDGKHCPRCGQPMTCKIVCETKEVKKVIWDVKCEPFCAPLPRLCGGCGCGDANCCGQCADGCCNKCDPCAAENAKKIVPPKCGCVRTKKTLEKKEVVCKVPTYKCVAVCSGCGHTASGAGVNCAPVAPVQEKASENTAPAAPAPSPKSTLIAPMPPALSMDWGR